MNFSTCWLISLASRLSKRRSTSLTKWSMSWNQGGGYRPHVLQICLLKGVWYIINNIYSIRRKNSELPHLCPSSSLRRHLVIRTEKSRTSSSVMMKINSTVMMRFMTPFLRDRLYMKMCWAFFSETQRATRESIWKV